MRTYTASALAVLASLGLAACAVGPDFVPPPKPDAKGYTVEPLSTNTVAAPVAGGEAQRFLPEQNISAQWWTLFHSPELNALIDEALAHNPNLQAAEAALRVAQENVAAQAGSYFPAVDANLSPTRQRVATGSVTTSAASGVALYSLHTAQLTVSYTPDLFGANGRAVESLQAQAQAQRFQWEAVRLTLTSNLVVAAVQEAALRGQLEATTASVAIQQRQLEILQRQLELGATAEVNVVAQEAALAQTRMLLPALNKQLAQQRNLLAAWVGRLPSEGPGAQFNLSSLQLPQALPLILPSALVAQRPDVRMAEEQLHAASAQIGVAESNRLPQFTLNASGGSVSTQIAQLFKSGNGFWSLAAGLTQPVFDGGTLLHRQRAAEAAFDEAAAQYRSTVLSALQNTADSLQALQFDAEQLQQAARARQSAANSLSIARKQMELGDTGTLELLNAELADQQSRMALAQAQASRYVDTAALFQALGGGWWQRTVASKVRASTSTSLSVTSTPTSTVSP